MRQINLLIVIIVTIIIIVIIIYEIGLSLLKVNNGSTRTMCEVCSTLPIKTPEWRYWRGSVVWILNIEQVSHIIMVLPLTLNMYLLFSFYSNAYRHKRWRCKILDMYLEQLIENIKWKISILATVLATYKLLLFNN